MASARAVGFDSINVDLIYGLPLQTAESFARTVEQVNALRPDRIALYAYAHLPERFKSQRRIAAAQLPGAGGKVRMLSDSMAALLAAGYVYIGMDHFALPTDELAIAQRLEGTGRPGRTRWSAVDAVEQHPDVRRSGAAPRRRRALMSCRPTAAPSTTIASAVAAVVSPESAAKNSACPLPATPAIPRISPPRTVRRMSRSGVPASRPM